MTREEMEAFAHALGILEQNRLLLESSARELLSAETLDEASLEAFFEKIELPEPEVG